MAVVINEFEVIPADPPPVSPSSEAAATTGETAPMPSTQDMGQLAERARERALRVWAH